MGLGQKLTKGVHKLGQKIENTSNKLGQKTNNVFKKVGGAINKVDNIATDLINDGSDLGQKIIQKSGAITNTLRAGSSIANAVAEEANRLGVPGASLASGATRQLARGADILDKKRDKGAKYIENIQRKALIEKSNARKRLENQMNDTQNSVSKFV